MTTQSRTLAHSHQLLLWAGRYMLGACLLLLGLGAISWLAGQSAKSQLVNQNPIPGLLVDVGGYKMHLNCIGDGRPTVIMDSGLGGFSIYWAQVQPEIARFSQVCVYDRAGYGWSEPSLHPRTSETIVKELHTLLTNAGVGKPYLLVGHSFGGMNMRLYAHHYPEEVTGMVLVDSVHEDQDFRLPAYKDAGAKMVRQFRFLALLRELGIVSLFPQKIPNPGFSAQTLAQYQAVLATTRYFETSNAESQAFEQSLSEFRQAKASKLDEMPIIVLSRGLPTRMPGLSWEENQLVEQIWRELQADLARSSSNSQHIVAERSGHDIPLQQPELVVEAVRQLINTSSNNDQPSSQQTTAASPGLTPSLKRPVSTLGETGQPDSSPAPTAESNLSVAPAQAEFTLRTLFDSGKMLYIGVGGEIDGVINPDLVVAPGTVVRAILVIGDGMTHDLFFPDFNAQTAAIGRKEETAEVTFTISEDQSGAYDYYCTLPGHRLAGQEGRLIVAPQGG